MSHAWLCEGMKDYRTFKEDFLKLVEFAEWYKDYIVQTLKLTPKLWASTFSSVFVRDGLVTYWQVGGCMSSYPRIPAYNAFLKEEGYVFAPIALDSLKIFYRI